MNKLAVLIFVVVLAAFASCRKEPNVVITVPPVFDTSAILKYSGSFQNGPYGVVKGKVEIFKQNGSFILRLSQFSSSSGPDLHVYLSKEVQPVNFIDLGTLRQLSGDQLYSIPGQPDFSEYKYSLIHCQAYNHLFGKTLIQ